MGTGLCLLGLLLAPGQPAERTDWPLTPRLGQAQELVYRGSYTEEDVDSSKQAKRSHRIEIRVFALNTSPRQTDVATLTILRPQSGANGTTKEAPGALVDLELGHVDAQGKVWFDEDPIAISHRRLLPSRECGMFVEAPEGRAEINKHWEIADPGQPAREWTLTGLVNLGSSRCLKLVGVQQSGWEKPQADQAAWRRSDTVWLIPRLGVAQRVERVIEHREPGRQVATQRSVLAYELESSLEYPGELSKDRRREIMAVRQFAESLASLQAKTPPYTKQLDALLARIDNHLENRPPTPYREAIGQIKRRVEAARRGESPPAPIALAKNGRPAAAQGSSPAPDLTAVNYQDRQSVALKAFLGKPALFVFYNPKSRTAEELLGFAQCVQDAHSDALKVVAFPISDDAEGIKKQNADLHLTILVLEGSKLRQRYAVEETPKLILLDAKGTVRGSYVGWGSETGPALQADLKKTLAAP
ncbi:MAG: peroxiredoxin family protein [Gemmataceae bacterium]